jgi:hypothetical protein
VLTQTLLEKTVKYTYRCIDCGHEEEKDLTMLLPIPEIIEEYSGHQAKGWSARMPCYGDLKRVWQAPMMNLGITSLTSDIEAYRFKNL